MGSEELKFGFPISHPFSVKTQPWVILSLDSSPLNIPKYAIVQAEKKTIVVGRARHGSRSHWGTPFRGALQGAARFDAAWKWGDYISPNLWLFHGESRGTWWLNWEKAVDGMGHPNFRQTQMRRSYQNEDGTDTKQDDGHGYLARSERELRWWCTWNWWLLYGKRAARTTRSPLTCQTSPHNQAPASPGTSGHPSCDSCFVLDRVSMRRGPSCPSTWALCDSLQNSESSPVGLDGVVA